MKTYVQPGEVLQLTAPSGGVVSGTPYLIGSLVSIALVTAAETVPYSAMVTGTATVPKATGGGSAWTEGVKLYWDDSAKKFTKTSGGNTLSGVAVAAAADGATTGVIRLDGVAR
jgi:predicted RecA/RadA family phage recombinase